MCAGLGGRLEAPRPFGGIKIMSIFAVVPSGHIHLNETARTLVLGHLKVAVSAIGRTVLGVVIGFFVTLHSAETGKSRSGRGSHLYLGRLDAAADCSSSGLRSAMFALDHGHR